MQGLLLFTLSRSDQSDECRSHSPFSAGIHSVNYVSMICPLDLRNANVEKYVIEIAKLFVIREKNVEKREDRRREFFRRKSNR